MTSCQLWLAMTYQSFFFVSISSWKSGVKGSPYRLHVQCLVNRLNPVQEVSYDHMLPFAVCVFSYIYLYFSDFTIYLYHGTDLLVHFGTHYLYLLFLWLEQSHLSSSCSYPRTDVTILCKNLTNALIYVNATLVLSCMIFLMCC
jgi:hypothetical protein